MNKLILQEEGKADRVFEILKTDIDWNYELNDLRNCRVIKEIKDQPKELKRKGVPVENYVEHLLKLGEQKEQDFPIVFENDNHFIQGYINPDGNLSFSIKDKRNNGSVFFFGNQIDLLIKAINKYKEIK